MLLLETWIYGKHQGAVITSSEEQDESLQLVLLGQRMVSKENLTATPLCPRELS